MVTSSTQADFFRVQLYPAGANSLAQTRLLIPLDNMLEVMTLPRQAICPVPGVAPGVLGVTNQRGQLIWVVDRRSPKGLGTSAARPNPQEKLTVVLLSQGDGGQVGFVVSQLEGIAPFDLGVAAPVATAWQGFYPHCDRQLVRGPEKGFTLAMAHLSQYLQGTLVNQ
ncbi:hypothetical protein AWQ21_11545 [Picosynechococcus sp. PCC 7003]|uniref:chemotaxis protein CheW n=1 Tax=Picosynechococcus sp. PCC 7003 TaxID=374981 RepID=UPI000810AFDC|nr:chemotaxis protein CheW [Picosynechococcus sp. PCC 7003]ANV84950.1 hypothetical protein AWQ21_11545 [Picosynechococcus sp. PCC 7003]